MKNRLFILIILAFISLRGTTQSSDYQWIISGAEGKRDYDSGNNIYGNVLGARFTLNGVSLPDRSTHDNARNDLLIIYEDGNHFNSRNLTGLGRFYEAGPYTTTDITIFAHTTPSVIGYLYLTDIYEEDDPPENVTVTNYTGAESAYNVDPITTAPLLSSNHHVVFNKDITVIINLNAVPGKLNVTDQLRLTFGDVDRGGHVDHNVDFFSYSRPFKNTSGYHSDFPIGSMTEGTREVTITDLNRQRPYRYINLQPDFNVAQHYAPIPGDTASVIFKLILNGEVIGTLSEQVLHSYDPNFLRVDSIQKDPEGGYFVYYHLEFENEGDIVANSLEASVIVPNVFNRDSVAPIKWSSSGRFCRGHRINSQDTVRFEFQGEEHNPLIKCVTVPAGIAAHPRDTVRCIGYVDFKVKVNPGYDVTDPRNSLMLADPRVSFNGIWFNLNEFYDLVRVKQGLFRKVYYRPLTGPTGLVENCWLLILLIAIVLFLLFFWRKEIFS